MIEVGRSVCLLRYFVSPCLRKLPIRGDESFEHRHNELHGIGERPAHLAGEDFGIGDELPLMGAFIPIAVLAAVIGLYLYEHAFVMAPQEVPNS